MPGLLVPARERVRLEAHIATFLETGDPGEFAGRLRVPLLRADGTERVVELIPVQVTVNGKTTFWGILRDLTEVERLDEQRAQFLAIVSHELRTPLTSIVSVSELIRGEAEGLTPEGRHFLDIIERNADRLLRLVGDLLMLDRLEAGALPLDLDLVSVSGLGNAVKFSHLDGHVRVIASCDAAMWRIDVSDTGIGIPPEDLARLFGPFVRGSNARTAGLPGTGLGLSIVKVLIEMHGGHVDVESVLDEGTTFSVFLPVAT